MGKHNDKIGQLPVITKGQKILKNRAVNPLQNGVIIITQRGRFYKKRPLYYSGTGIGNWGKSYCKVGQVSHFKVGQSLLQCVVGIIKWCTFIAKWDNYFRKGQYIFVTPEETENHVYWQGKYALRTEFYMIWYPSDGSNHFRKTHIFARTHVIYDVFGLTGYAIFPSRYTRSFERL